MESSSNEVISLRSEYKDFVFNFTDFIWEVDKNGKYTYAAGKTEDVLGYKPSDIIGKTPFDFMTSDEAKRIGETFINIVKDEKLIVDLENWNISKSGKMVCLLTNGKPIYDDDGNFSGYHGVDKDITDKKILENELLALNKNLEQKVHEEVDKNRIKDKQLLVQSRLAQMGEMISMIAHQWRQPLTTITAMASSLQLSIDIGEYDLTKEEDIEKHNRYIKEKISTLANHAQTLSQIISNFRNFYTPTKKEKLVSITNPITNAINIIQPIVDHNGIKIVEKYDNLREIYLHKNELIQVIVNILKNSLDSFKDNMTPNPTITLTTKINDGADVIEICDNGSGIPIDSIDRVFEPYFSTKSLKNGTGLGLYMSKIIIEKHHKGSLTFKNIYNKDGSLSGVCFKIKL